MEIPRKFPHHTILKHPETSALIYLESKDQTQREQSISWANIKFWSYLLRRGSNPEIIINIEENNRDHLPSENATLHLLRVLLVLFSIFNLCSPMVYLRDRFFCTHIIPHHRKSCLISQQKSWAVEPSSNNGIQITTFSALRTWPLIYNLKALKPKLQPLGHSWE